MLGHRDRRDRQVAARLGVREVRRRARRRRLVAPRPLPRLRRGRRVLGAGGDGADARRDRRGRGAARRRARSCAPTLEEHVADAEERAWVEPRLAHLLGLEEGAPGDQEDLFAAWRLFFERLAERTRRSSSSRTCSGPTRACSTSSSTCSTGRATTRSSCSRSPARSSPSAARPGAPASAASRSLLPGAARRAAMDALLTASCPGCPSDLRDAILERAEGVPLYAVETVRMLLDRGLLVPRTATSTGRPGRVETLEVPETLHALDRRPPRRARRRGAAARSRTRRCSARPSPAGARRARPASPRAELEPLLASLVRKEVLSVQADPRSPERGQYGFLQDLVARRLRDARPAASARPAPRRGRSTSSGGSATRTRSSRSLAAHYLDALRAPRPTPTTPARSARRRARCSSAPASAQRRSPPTRRPSATSSRRPSSSTTSRSRRPSCTSARA